MADGGRDGAVVAVQRDLEATADARAVDGGECRVWQRTEPPEALVSHPRCGAGQLGRRHRREGVEVGAGREDERLAGEDEALPVALLEFGEDLAERGEGALAERGRDLPVGAVVGGEDGDPAGRGRGGPEEELRPGLSHPSRSQSWATPIPIPTQRAVRPYRTPVSSRRCASCASRRAPVAASGWPQAIAPPYGLRRSSAGSMPSASHQASTCTAKGSLSSIAPTSSRPTPARASTWRVAGIGPSPIRCGATPVVAKPTRRMRGRRPSSAAVSAAASSVALAPSVRPAAFPAVTRPPGRNAGRSVASASREVSGRSSSSRSARAQPAVGEDRHRDDGPRVDAVRVVPVARCAALALEREGVGGLPGQVGEGVVQVLGRLAHHGCALVDQPVGDEARIEVDLRPHRVPAHVLDPAGHDDVAGAERDRAGRDRRGGQRAGAHPVDGHPRHRMGEAGEERDVAPESQPLVAHLRGGREDDVADPLRRQRRVAPQELAHGLHRQVVRARPAVEPVGLALPKAVRTPSTITTSRGEGMEGGYALTRQFLGLHHAVGGHHRGGRRDVEAGLDHAVVAKADADAGVGPDQRALADGDGLLAAARERAHDRRAAAHVAAVAHHDAGRDPALDHRRTERARAGEPSPATSMPKSTECGCSSMRYLSM